MSETGTNVVTLPDDVERDARRMADLMLQAPKWERRFLIYVAERILGGDGLRKYGPADPDDGRDWEHEALEEMSDGMFYIAMRLFRTKRD